MADASRRYWRAPTPENARRELRELVALARRVVLAAALTGVVTGAVVGLFERVVAAEMLHAVLDAPVGIQVILPALGLLVSALALRWVGGGVSPATTDEYLKAFHGQEARFDARAYAGRFLASAATLGSGGAMGFEGPSVYFGAGIGNALGTQVRALLARDDVRLLLVAGVAAGVGAIFKAPATGAVFAIEVPFRDELARRSLIPALVGAAAGYLTFVAINGTQPLFPIQGSTIVSGRDLAGAALVGVTCGFGARVFAWVIRGAKALSGSVAQVVAVPLSGLVLGALVLASRAAFDGEAFSLGNGYHAVRWVFQDDTTFWLLVVLSLVRVLATAATVAGSGTGGLFIPLVIQGAITGQMIGLLVDTSNPGLYPVLGVAAFLGAGYRVPLAAVMFIAEATGRPGFVVPGLIAAVFSQLLAGGSSVTNFQRDERLGHIERRAEMPISSALITDVATAGPDDTLAELFTEHIALARRRAVPVVTEDRSYLGMVLIDDVLAVDNAEWIDTTVGDVMRTDLPVLDPESTIAAAITALATSPSTHLAVGHEGGRVYGLVSQESIFDLADLLERIDPDTSER